MTATKYLLLRILYATRLPLSTRNLLKQVPQEGRFLNQLYVRLGARRWRCAEGVPELKTQFTLIERLENSRASIRERISSLREQLASYDVTDPVPEGQADKEQEDKPDALIKEIRYRQDSILKKSVETERLRRVLGDKDVLYQEYARELEILRQHLRHLQKKLSSFRQIEVSKPSDSRQTIDIARQKLTIALQSLKLNDRQLDTLMEPYHVKIGRYLTLRPELLRRSGKLQGTDRRLLALIRAVDRSHERLCRLCNR